MRSEKTIILLIILLCFTVLPGCNRKVSRSLSATEVQTAHTNTQTRRTVIEEQAADTIHLPQASFTSVFNPCDTAVQTVEDDNQVLSVQVKDGRGRVVSIIKPKVVPISINHKVVTSEQMVQTENLKASQATEVKQVRQGVGWYGVVVMLAVLAVVCYCVWRRFLV